MRDIHVVRRHTVRRHLPTACLVSIVIALQPVPSMRVQLPESTPGSTRPEFQVTARLCVSGDRCGSLVARVSAAADAR